MQPLYLRFKGLASYNNEQHIDFNDFTNARLFGIFGDTGSGKSTVLDAIAIALYGKTLRDNKRSVKPLINLHNPELIIDFIFRGFDSHIYAFSYRLGVKARKRKKHTGEAFQEKDYNSSADRNYYRYHGTDTQGEALWKSFQNKTQEWLPLDDKKGEEQAALEGIPIEHFTQTIILPQGKFDAFIKAQPAERSSFLRDLFNLNRYEKIRDKVKEKYEEIKREYGDLEVRLQEYEDINENILQQKQEEEKQLQQQLCARQAEVEQLERQVQEIELAKAKENQLKSLESQLDDIRERLQQLPHDLPKQHERLQTAQKFFAEPLRDCTHYQKSRKDYQEKATQLTQSLEQRQKMLDEAQARLSALQPEYDQLPDRQKAINYLQDYIEIRKEIEQKKQNILNKQVQIKTLQQEYQTLQQALEKINRDIEQTQQHLKTLRQEKLSDIISSLKTLHQHSIKYEEERHKCRKEYKALQATLKSIHATAADLPALLKEAVDQNRLSGLQGKLSEELLQIKTKIQLHTYRQSLRPGTPCPLCGSTEHPVREQPSEQITTDKELKQQAERLEQAMERLRHMQSGWDRLQYLKKLFISAIEKYNQEKPNGFPVLPMQDTELPTQEMLTSLLQQAEEKKGTLEKAEDILEVLNQKKEAKRTETTKKEQALAECKGALAELEKRKEELEKKLEYYEQSHPEYQQKSIEELNAILQDLQQTYEEVKDSYERAKEEFNNLNEKQSMEKGRLETLQESIRAAENKITQSSQQLERLLKEYSHQFGSIEEVKTVLAQKEYIEENMRRREELLSKESAFQEQLKKIQTELRQHKVPDSPEQLLQIRNQYHEKKQLLGELQKTSGKLEEEITQLKQKLEDKHRWTTRYEEVKKQLITWEKIKNLFDGNSFLNFVLKNYLDDINKYANRYFTKLTNNELSCEVTTEKDKIEIIITDHLNQGKRQLGSLSGGQNFILSLSLALALSELLQDTHRIRQHFFFIDEGFGSLDENILSEVMDVLESLANSDKVIGVISHVRYMQERISTALFASRNQQGQSTLSRTGEATLQ